MALHISNTAFVKALSRLSPATGRPVAGCRRSPWPHLQFPLPLRQRPVARDCLREQPTVVGVRSVWLSSRRLPVNGQRQSLTFALQRKKTMAASEMQSNVTPAAEVKAELGIELVPCLSDNYAYLIHDEEKGVTGIVDPSEASPVIKALEKRGLALTHILNTHHHHDHTGGNLELKRRYGAQVVGPTADEARIPGIDVALQEGDTWQFGNHLMRVFDTPGHTRGHVCFYFPASKAVFTGDTLFSVGCGRLFEGTPHQMWTSLSKLISLPAETRIFCGHEYTEANVRFALSVEPENQELKARAQEVKELRTRGKPTIPSTIGLECATNPFLRPSSEELRRILKLSANVNDVDAFAAARRAKDRF